MKQDPLTETGFYGEIRRRSDPMWKEVHGHPFVRGIGDGTLSRERFEFYLKQDYVYLVDFSRVFAMAAAKSEQLSDMAAFATLLNLTLNTEMELHRKTCAAYGIPAPELEGTPKAPATAAYTDYLLRTCHEGDLSDILAVLVPCACGYVEIAKGLGSRGLPADPFLRDWITQYASKEFEDYADWLIERMNAHAEGVPARLKERWYRLYETSARHEYLFFDMSWKMERGS